MDLTSQNCVGACVALNKLNLSSIILFCVADRSDYGRDLANFLIHYLPEGSRFYGEDIPVQLPRLPELVTKERCKNGFSDRALVAIGHSLGGDAVYVNIGHHHSAYYTHSFMIVFRAVCAISYPKLFSSVILTETTLFPPSNNDSNSKIKHVIFSGTLGRRSTWASRSAIQAKKCSLYSLFLLIDKKRGSHCSIRRFSKPWIPQC